MRLRNLVLSETTTQLTDAQIQKQQLQDSELCYPNGHWHLWG